MTSSFWRLFEQKLVEVKLKTANRLYLLSVERKRCFVLLLYLCYVFIRRFACYSSAVIGEIDDDTDSSLDMANIRADPLNPVVY